MENKTDLIDNIIATVLEETETEGDYANRDVYAYVPKENYDKLRNHIFEILKSQSD